MTEYANPSANCCALVVVNTTARRGAELEGAELATELTARGNRCHVVALAPASGLSTTIEVLGKSPLHPLTLRALRRAAQRVDVVIAYGSSTLPACALGLAASGIPFVYRSIGDPADWVRGPFHRRRTALCFRRAAHVVALWERAGDDIARLYSLPRERIDVIPNARSGHNFRPPSRTERDIARRSWGVDDERPVLVILGALVPEKQVERAVAAMEYLPEASMLVVGDGPQRSAIAALAAASPTHNVTLTGFVDDPRRLLHAADVVVLASRTEGMPGVVIEAGLSGVPAVAPAVGTIPRMIVDGVSGVVVSGSEPEALAKGIRLALAQREQMGVAARAHMDQYFTWDRVVPAWLDVLSAVVTAR